MNRFLTRGLFYEITNDEAYAVFTMQDEDRTVGKKKYISLKKIYMSYSHIPGFEYEFALDVFNSWDHWCKLTEDSSERLRTMFQDWRDELEVRNKAQALKSLIEVSMVSDPKGVAAAKYLAESGYISKRGRPSKDEVTRERKQQAAIKETLSEDMARLGLSVVNGAK